MVWVDRLPVTSERFGEHYTAIYAAACGGTKAVACAKELVETVGNRLPRGAVDGGLD